MKLKLIAAAAVLCAVGALIPLSFMLVRRGTVPAPESSGIGRQAEKAEKSGWSRWRGRDGNGISYESGWDTEFAAKPVRLNWKVNIGEGFSNVSVTDEYVYTMGYDKVSSKNIIYCLKRKTGETLWRHAYRTYPSIDGHHGPRSTPVLDEDRLYTFGQNGEILCNNAVTGEFIWNLYNKFSAPNPSRELGASPYLHGGLVVVNAFRSGMAVNKDTGKTIWKSGGNDGNNSTPAAYRHKGEKRLALFGQHYLYGIKPENGKTVWSYPWPSSSGVNAADPAAYGEEKLFVSSGDSTGCALLDLSGGKPAVLWRNKNLSAHVASPVIIGDFVYGIDGNAGRDARLTCLDLRDGSIRWTSGKTGCGNFIAADGYIIMISETGNLLVAEARPDRFSLIGMQKKVLPPICLTAPVLYASTLYLRNSRGDLISVDISKNNSAAPLNTGAVSYLY